MSEYLGTQESDRVASRRRRSDDGRPDLTDGGHCPQGLDVAIGLGLVAIEIGVIVLVWPDRTLRVVGILFGIYLLVSGFLEIVVAFAPQERRACASWP